MRSGPLICGLLGLVMSVTAGCATRFRDREGNIHTIGFVWHTTVPASTEPSSEGAVIALGPTTDLDARIVQSRSVGMLVSWTDADRGISIGLSDSLLVYPTVHGFTHVTFEAAHPLEASMEVTPVEEPIPPGNTQLKTESETKPEK